MVLKNKKELENFIVNIDIDIDIENLIRYLNDYGIKGILIDDFVNKIDEIQKFYEREFSTKDEDMQNQLRRGFWAFFQNY